MKPNPLKIRKTKDPGTSVVVTEMLLALGNLSLEWMTGFLNCILSKKRIPDDSNTRIIVNCFKHRGEADERRNFRGLKLWEHIIKVFGRILEEEIRKVIDINEM